jgi:hypothetical protein
VYATIELAATGTGDIWTAPRLKEVLKVAISLVRNSKNVLGLEAAKDAWNMGRLEQVIVQFKSGDRTGKMTGIVALLGQLSAVLQQSKGGSQMATVKAATRVENGDDKGESEKVKAIPNGKVKRKKVDAAGSEKVKKVKKVKAST